MHKFTVDLPKKHGRGGQSALRFARLRMEKRHNYVRKVAEVATQLFISNDKANIAGLILAGSADFKTELSQSDMFDPVSTRFSNFQFLVLNFIEIFEILFLIINKLTNFSVSKQKSSNWWTSPTAAKTVSIKPSNWRPNHCKTSNLYKKRN